MKSLVPLTAITAILILLMFALYQGIDGLILAGGLTIIGGLGGYVARGLTKR